jgi:hypothetical protein
MKCDSDIYNSIGLRTLWRYTLLVAFIFSSGCAHTRIAPRPVPAEAQRLIALAQRNVSISVDCPVDEIVGHQYLLIILPFGRISIAEVDQHIKNALVTELSQSGIAVSFIARDQNPDLVIRCNTLSLSAYDLIFVRRIVAHLSLQVSHKHSLDISIPYEIGESEYRSFAFHAQLERTLLKLLSSAAERVNQALVSPYTK